jgi:hypothetical protein
VLYAVVCYSPSQGCNTGSNPVGSAISKQKAGASSTFCFDSPYEIRTCAGDQPAWVRQIDRPGDLNAGGLADSGPEGARREAPSNPVGSAIKSSSYAKSDNAVRKTLSRFVGLLSAKTPDRPQPNSRYGCFDCLQSSGSN